jgi:aryl-alcohol dehydrogenase-like predicted oxidoreductase
MRDALHIRRRVPEAPPELQLGAMNFGKRTPEKEGCTRVQLAYAWLASRPDVDSILVGPGTVEHLDEAIDGVERSLSREAAGKLDELARAWSGSDTNYVR